MAIVDISQIEDYGKKHGTENFSPKVNKMIQENKDFINSKIKEDNISWIEMMINNINNQPTGEHYYNSLIEKINKAKNEGINVSNFILLFLYCLNKFLFRIIKQF